MKINADYDCKIMMFGAVAKKSTENIAICKIINKDVIIGSRAMVEVDVCGSRYYIDLDTVKEYINEENIKFYCTRKDLIQVNEIIHGDILL